MLPIIGQEKLKKQLDSYTLQTVPKTMLFLGPEGCGKATFARYLAEKLELDLVEIDNSITHEQLVEYSQDVRLRLYLIKLSNFVEKQQNQFLKFIEEPSSTAYIILTADSERGILPTILNRCITFYFEPYTIDQLKQFEWTTSFFKDSYDQNLIYNVYNTPGQLLDLEPKLDVIDETYKFCELIVTKIHAAPYANTMSIINKLKCKDEIKKEQDLSKFEINSFLKILEFVAFNNYKETKSDLSLKIYLYTNSFKQNMFNKTLNKEACMLNFLNGLWLETH